MRGRRPAANTPELATKAAAEFARLRTDPLRLPAQQWMKPLPDGEWDRDLTEQVFHARAALLRATPAEKRGTDIGLAHLAADALMLPRGTVRFDLPPGAAAVVRALAK